MSHALLEVRVHLWNGFFRWERDSPTSPSDCFFHRNALVLSGAFHTFHHRDNETCKTLVKDTARVSARLGCRHSRSRPRGRLLSFTMEYTLDDSRSEGAPARGGAGLWLCLRRTPHAANADAAATQARSVCGARRRRAEQRAADPSLRASRA